MRGTGILLNDEYDFQVKPERGSSGKIERGLVIGRSLFQNQAIIIGCHAGEISESPQLGVGIEDMLLDNDYPLWRRAIRMNMERDGQTVNDVVFSKHKRLSIDADYS